MKGGNICIRGTTVPPDVQKYLILHNLVAPCLMVMWPSKLASLHLSPSLLERHIKDTMYGKIVLAILERLKGLLHKITIHSFHRNTSKSETIQATVKQSIEMAIARHLPAYCRSECFGKKDFLRYCGHSRYCRIRARSRLALVLFPEALRFSVFPDSLKTTISSTLKTTRARAICRKRMRIQHTSQRKV